MSIDKCNYYEVFLARTANKYGLAEDIELDNEGLVYARDELGMGMK